MMSPITGIGSALPARAKACKTCRIRRVKCDKTFPVCLKCASTKRQCDGYGIWGGGSEAKSEPAPTTKSVFIAQKDRVADVQHISMLAIPAEDKETLEWFQYRTMRKTPGMFKSDFWDTLLLQASSTEPAVMHGVLALSSVHRSGVSLEMKIILSNQTAARLWTAGLRHYVDAIQLLRQRVSSRGMQDRATLRIVIITCMVFVCVEILRGEIDSAQAHLRSGLSLLREAGWFSEHNEPTAEALKSPDTVDRWITEALSRIYLHDETFNLIFLNRSPANNLPWRGGSIFSNVQLSSAFTYMEEAWASADRLFLASIQLTQWCKSVLRNGRQPLDDDLLVTRRKQLQGYLSRWSKAFNQSRKAPWKLPRVEYDQSPALIQISFSLAKILTETSLYVNDEMIYDRHTGTFRYLLEATSEMLRIYREQSKLKTGRPLLMSFTILDICSLPVLYFVVTKCRVVEVRHQALARLKVLRNRECHWEGLLSYRVAKKIMELEEGNASYDSSPSEASGVLPASSRLQDLRIVTEGNPFTTLTLEFKRGPNNSGSSDTQRVDLDVQSGVWSDGS